MKKLMFLLSIVLACTVNIHAQEADIEDPNAPEINFEKLVHDYGTIEQGSDGKCEFVFTNTGKQPLVLSQPRSSCGCTVPSWPKEPVLPGESEKITVTYNTSRVGSFSKSITIMSNAKNKMVVLHIKGKVKEKSAE